MIYKNYGEKLKDPRWQKKRLEVFQRDEFMCQNVGCLATDKTLHVHHLIYFKGKEPWDIDIKYLLTLCEDCHEELELIQYEQCERLINAFKAGLTNTFIRNCGIEVFEKSKNLNDLIFLLWETIPNDEEKVTEFLKSINHS